MQKPRRLKPPRLYTKHTKVNLEPKLGDNYCKSCHICIGFSLDQHFYNREILIPDNGNIFLELHKNSTSI